MQNYTYRLAMSCCLSDVQVLKRMSAMVGTRLSITHQKGSPQSVLADDARLYQVCSLAASTSSKHPAKACSLRCRDGARECMDSLIHPLSRWCTA